MGPEDLSALLSYLPKRRLPGLLSGMEDDAAAFQISEDLAVVQTVDFITPIINNPFSFGAIAAANALSDIYAMGATPVFALNLVSFPINSMPMETLGAILKGGADKAEEAGIAIVGGHSVDDTTPKYGLSVTGLVNPKKLIQKKGAQVGDILILTKPLGTGILTAGIDAGIAEADVEAVAADVMLELNRAAAETMLSFPVHACTDVSGFGLLGHLHELLDSEITALLNYGALPILPQVWDILKQGGVSSGTQANARYFSKQVTWLGKFDHAQQTVLFDAQTSGGLLVALPEESAPAFVKALTTAGTLAAHPIGSIIPRRERPLVIQD